MGVEEAARSALPFSKLLCVSKKKLQVAVPASAFNFHKVGATVRCPSSSQRQFVGKLAVTQQAANANDFWLAPQSGFNIRRGLLG